MRSLQYCCLLIPVKNRELLQMLLKFMVKLMDNHVISLSDELPTKEMVREWCIARTEHLALKFTRLSLKLVLSCKHKKSKILPVFISTWFIDWLIDLLLFVEFSKKLLFFLHYSWRQLIQSFSRAIFGVTADMDAIRLVYFMMETFPEFFKVRARHFSNKFKDLAMAGCLKWVDLKLGLWLNFV